MVATVNVTRAQVVAAVMCLGLDPDTVGGLVLLPESLTVELGPHSASLELPIIDG